MSSSPYNRTGATFVLLATGLIGYFIGWDLRDQDLQLEKRLASAHSPAHELAADPDTRSPLYSTAARILEEKYGTLGIPDDRFISSLEGFWPEEKENLHFLARLWPPWPVSQPEDAVKPLTRRAIEITADGRCFLRAVPTPGPDAWQALDYTEYQGQDNIHIPPLLAPDPQPARRRVILPPAKY